METKNVPIVYKYEMDAIKNVDLIGPFATIEVSERKEPDESLEEYKHRVRKKAQQTFMEVSRENNQFKDGEFLLVIRDDPLRVVYGTKMDKDGQVVGDTKRTVCTYTLVCDVYQMKPYELEKRYRLS